MRAILLTIILIPIIISHRSRLRDDGYGGDICPFPWQTHEQNLLASYSQCSEFAELGVKCSPHDPIECTGRNPVCVYSNATEDFRCCSDIPQDLSNLPGIEEQVKPICPYGASSYDMPSIKLCDPEEEDNCPDEYKCEQAVNHQMLATANMYLCCEIASLDSFSAVFQTKKIGMIKMSENFSTPAVYRLTIAPAIIPHAPDSGIDFCVLSEASQSKGPLPEIRTGDYFSMLPYRFREPVNIQKVRLLREQMPGYFHHVLVLYNPHGNPESMHLYYNRPSSLSQEIELKVANGEEGVFIRNINRVLTITTDQTYSKKINKLYIVLVFQTKFRFTRRHPQFNMDLHANYTSLAHFLESPTGKALGAPKAGTYFYITT